MKKYICLIVGISLFSFVGHAQSAECKKILRIVEANALNVASEAKKFLSNENNYYQGRLRTGQTFEEFNKEFAEGRQVIGPYNESNFESALEAACSDSGFGFLREVYDMNKRLKKEQEVLRNIFCDTSIKTGAMPSDFAYYNHTCLSHIACANDKKKKSLLSWFSSDDNTPLNSAEKLQKCQTFKFK